MEKTAAEADKMHHITFILGGCRSGKSRHALFLAEKSTQDNRLFLATCVPEDDEMRDRVSRHQSERGKGWKTIEEPLDIGGVIDVHGGNASVILLDCLTLWMGNLFMRSMDMDAIRSETQKLTAALNRCPCPVIVVSNEVGMGIVPENALARAYRDAVGWVNQAVAACADRVILTVAGIPMVVK
jgi:adenosylcobinamide kinase / adenosylcobinamide-phosphate guanylyltransferase